MEEVRAADNQQGKINKAAVVSSHLYKVGLANVSDKYASQHGRSYPHPPAGMLIRETQRNRHL